MSWLFFAFSGPVLWAASTHIDKYLVERYFKAGSTAVLMVFTALIGLFTLPFVWFYHPEVLALPLPSIAVIAFSGVLYMGAILFYLQALQTEEASVVAPFFQATPFFAFALAYIVLGETLTRVQIAGGVLIVLGALILSLHFGADKRRIKMRLVFWMLLATFCIALTSVIFKFFAVEDAYWTTTFWMFVGEALFGAGVLMIPRYWHQFIHLMRANTKAMLAINGANELINLGGGLGVRYASLLAPLSLVQAISSTSSLFVFLFGMLLSLFIPALGREDLSRRNLIQKGVATVFIVAGVIIANR